MTGFLHQVARFTRSQLGQEVILGHRELHDDLANNRALATSTWLALWATKPKVQMAISLVSYPIQSECVDMVVRRERRVLVLDKLLKITPMSGGQGATLLKRNVLDCLAARSWWQRGTVPDELGQQVAMLAGSEYLAEYAAPRPEFTDAQVADFLSNQWGDYSTHAQKALECRPSLAVELMTRDNRALRSAAASSRHMFDQDMMLLALTGKDNLARQRKATPYLSLAFNPNTQMGTLQRALSIATCDSVTSRLDIDAFEKAVEKRLSEHPYAVTVPWEEVTLPKDKLLILRYAKSNRVREAAVKKLPSFTLDEVRTLDPFYGMNLNPSLPKPGVWGDLMESDVSFVAGTAFSLAQVELLSDELDLLGRQAWENAVVLLGDLFEGNLRGLLATARLL